MKPDNLKMTLVQGIRRKLYPSTVLKMYIKLYCKRRNSSKTKKMMEAINSWVTLDKNERELFVRKYEECQTNYKKMIADYLSKTEPYLKKKAEKRVDQDAVRKKDNILDNEQVTDKETGQDENLLDVHNSLQSLDNNSASSNNMDVLEEIHCHTNEPLESPTCSNKSDFIANQQCDNVNSSHQPSNGILSEPTPPNIKCAQDLFLMIKSNNKESSDTWSLLSSTQKSRYRKAVSILKDDYIIKFKAYLESLPSKQLFKYYNDYFN